MCFLHPHELTERRFLLQEKPVWIERMHLKVARNRNARKTMWIHQKNNVKPLTASVRKLKKQNSNSSEDYTSEEENDSWGLQGFCFIDISVLASVFESLCCPLYKQGQAVLEEDKKTKMGLASLLISMRTSSKCKFEKSFLYIYQSGKQSSLRSKQESGFGTKKFWHWSSRSHQVLLCNEYVTTN